MDAAAAQARYRRNLADREPGIMGRNDGPNAFALGFCSPCCRQLQPVLQLSFMLDKLVECFTCSSHGQSITGCVSGVQQTGRFSVHFCSVAVPVAIEPARSAQHAR
jgi:hypothetical protein